MGRHSSSGGRRAGDRSSSAFDGARPVDRGSSERKTRGSSEPGRGRRSSSPSSGGYSLSDPASRRRGSLEAAPARLNAEVQRRRKRRKTIAIASVAALGVVLLAVVASGYFYAKHIESTMQGPVKKQAKAVKAALKEPEPQKPYTVLILGGDHRRGEDRYRTDTMILARIDPQQKKVWMLSIPRDTRVNIPGKGTHKINQAFFYGGPELAIKTVNKFTGVPINHYLEVNFGGFARAVDALGGVWVDVPVEIDDPKAASQSTGRSARHIEAGYQKLDGQHALTFVRSRDFPDGDFSRMKNQQIFFKALADQVSKTSNLTKLPKIISSIAPYISTDMALMDLVRTGQALKNAGSQNVYTATVTGEWKSPFVWPNEEKLNELVAAMNEGRSFDSTATTATPAAKKPSQISVTVRNGAGIAGCAKQAAAMLTAKGFKLGEVGNANQFVYDNTLVVYQTDKASAQLVASVLPEGAKLVQSRGMYAYPGEILVVVGKDWDPARPPASAAGSGSTN